MGVQVNLATKDRQGNPLSISQRQFISFSYGGKNIEDFDLLVVFSNGRLDKDIYFPFSDITSKNEVLDGQLYWDSTFEAGRLSFNLATDGMTSENYEAFKNYFVPGEIRELILSEFPNRAIMARVASAPHISLLPFEDKKEIKIGNEVKKISTSLYKGDISLEFIMDEPYWYAKKSCIDNTVENYNYPDEDVKIIYEDKIPALSMFAEGVFLLGNNIKIKDGKILESTQEISLADNPYLYNCGTAAAKPIISFKIQPSFSEEGKIIFSNNMPYIKIGENQLNFTTPNVITSYNQTLEILENNFTIGDTILEIRNYFRDNLHNYYTRAYMIALLDSMRENSIYDNNGAVTETFFIYFKNEMKKFLVKNDKIFPFICIINSQTGESKISFSCYTYGSENEINIEENAGDMIKSKYLKIEDRTIFSIDKNTGDTIISTNECLKISSNCDLSNLIIDFKYTYL